MREFPVDVEQIIDFLLDFFSYICRIVLLVNGQEVVHENL